MDSVLKNYVYPIATLAGSIIGVGFLSLPYITLKVGIWPMVFSFAVLTFLITLVHVIFGQISLKTPDHKRFPGFVGYYLGDFAKIIALLLMIFGSLGSLLIYLIVGGQFLATMASPFFGAGMLAYVVLYFIAASALVYFGVEKISKVEFWALIFLCGALLVICVASFSHIKPGNIFFVQPDIWGNAKILFLPYGAVIFALWGTGLIPETEEMLVGKKKLLKRVIIISTLIPAAIYLAFIFLVLGISGGQTTQVALTGLQHFLGPGLFSLALFIGVATTFTSFITQALLLKKTFMYDMGISEFPSWVFSCFVPMILFLLGFTSFISLISFIGGFLLSIDGILILLMYKKIGGRNIIIYPLAFVFILGVIYELVYFIH